MINETTYYKLQDEWRIFRNNLDPLIVTTEDGDILTWHYDDDCMSKTHVTIDTNNCLLSYLIRHAPDAKYYLNYSNKELINVYIEYIEYTISEYKNDNLLKNYDDYTVQCICDDESYGSYVTWKNDADDAKRVELHDALELIEKSGYTVIKN
jgi:hypothetical protein